MKIFLYIGNGKSAFGDYFHFDDPDAEEGFFVSGGNGSIERSKRS